MANFQRQTATSILQTTILEPADRKLDNFLPFISIGYYTMLKRVCACFSPLHTLACTDLKNLFFLLINVCLINKSIKFDKDSCFRWGDIQLLVTMYIRYFALNYSQFLTENFDFFETPSWKCFYIFSARYLSLKERKRICAFLWKNEPRRTSALHMIWWHSANRDVPPGRFQPYEGCWWIYFDFCFSLT